MNLDSIKQLVKLINDSKLTELEMNLDNISLKIKKSEEKSKQINVLKSKEYSLIKLNNVIK